MLQALDAFLTAYDPSDLPGGSVDPMGFDRGYAFLADCLLPGMTNVASRPRYLSALCTGVLLADVAPDASPRLQRERRRECGLRFERLWALANALAAARPDAEVAASGIRGVTYVSSELARLERKGTSRASARYKLLARQQQYGMFGIYGAIAEGMRLVDRRSLLLTPDAGARLAEAFIDETRMPGAVRRAVQAAKDDEDIGLEVLADWGSRAHVDVEPGRAETAVLREALMRHPLRARTAAVLAEHPRRKSDGADPDSELRRIAWMADRLRPRAANRDLRAAMLAILAFEDCYRLSLLAFERILWLCRMGPAGAQRLADLSHDEVVRQVADALPGAVDALCRTLDALHEAVPALTFDRIGDAQQFLIAAGSMAGDVPALVHAVLARHADVQHGKFDRGRRKMAWVEESKGSVSLTMTRVGGRNFEVREPAQITPHVYRLASADAFLRHGGTP